MNTLTAYIVSAGRARKVIASELGISPSYMSDLESGRREPGADVAERIAVATNGAVPVTSWPNHAAVAAAIERTSGLGRAAE